MPELTAEMNASADATDMPEVCRSGSFTFSRFRSSYGMCLSRQPMRLRRAGFFSSETPLFAKI